jgi:malonyl-CoA O-methyltransferase
MNKDLIKQRFSKQLNIYDEHAKIQKQMAEKLIKFLPQSNFDTILEIGSGTGLLTKFAHEKLQYKKYTAIDIVPKCEKYIKEINSEIEFISKDAEEFINTTNEKYDLVISNASLQWIENIPDFVHKLTTKLNQGGTILFSTFGTENYREIYFVLGKTLPYLSYKELVDIFAEYSPIIEEEIRIMAFKSPKDILKHIKNTGVNAISTEHWTKKNLLNFEKEYNSFCAYHPTLTYNPIYVYIKLK